MPVLDEPAVKQKEGEPDEAVFIRMREYVQLHGETPDVKRLREDTRDRLRPIPVSWSPSDPSYP